MRRSPELMVATMVVGGLGLLFVILFASEGGVWAWIVLGLFILAALLLVARATMRRPRGAGPFEGGAAPAGDGLHRILLVVDARYGADDLRQLPSGRYLVVAPAVSSRVARLTGDEKAYREAEQHLQATVGALNDLGFAAEGHVASHDPLQAADEALREFPADEIVFALGRGGDSEWLELGVVDDARTRYAVPVRELGGPVAGS